MEKQNKIRVLEFRILQLEIALGSLMQVVAFPEKNTSFRTRMEEAMKICRRGDKWELLYADDLVITAESNEEAQQRFMEWMQSMESAGLRVNIEKTKFMVIGGRVEDCVVSGRYPCGVCGRGVGVNSILCNVCDRWVHKRCTGLRSVNRVSNFCCPACTRRREGRTIRREPIVVGDDELGEVDQFCYLGDIVDSEAGVERSVRARAAAAWRSWREIAGLLINKNIPLKRRARVYDACIRPVVLSG